MTLKGQLRVSDAPAAGHVLTTTAVGESNVDVGTVIDRPQTDGCYSYRKRLIEQQDVTKPPSDEGGGFAEGELGGRDNATRQ